MPKNKKNLEHIVSQLDPELVARSTKGDTLDLTLLLGEVTQQYLSLQEIHENQSTGSENDSLAQFDPLTLLPNRSFFAQYVDQAIKRAQRNKRSFALIFIDIDHFKTINDTHGHRTGDRLLKLLSERILKSIRKTDVLCRLSGDEFCLLVEELDKSDAVIRVISTIQQNLLRAFQIGEQSIVVTCSIGVSVYPDDGKSFHDLLHYADLAMYEAKRNGRNSVSIFTPEISANIKRLNQQQKLLKTAIKIQKFQFSMQPELDLKTGDICAARQVVGLESPCFNSEQDIFLTAQRSKLLTMLNQELIRNACEVSRDWRQTFKHRPRVVLPLYRDLLCSPRCHTLVRDAIEKYAISGQQLEFEIKESDLNHQCDHGYHNLKKLFMMGCKISLINFGLGPSSFRLLSSGFIYKIKIDGTLINSLEEDEQSRLMMEAIIDLCDKFDIRTVALDITTLSQIRLLESFRCNGIRGDFLSPALSREQFEQVLSSYDRQKTVDLSFWQKQKSDAEFSVT